MLADHAVIVMGQSPKAADVNEEGIGLPLLNGPTEFGSTHPTPVQYTTKASKHCQEGDLLFCVRGSTTGKMNWADQPYAIGRGIAAVRHKRGEQLQPFLRAVIEHELNALLVQATGSTFPNVSSAMLGRVRWPDLSEEAEINASALLSALDDKIDLLRRMNSILQEIARALFSAWFVDFLPVRAKAEGATEFRGMPKELFDALADSFEPTEIGAIPKKWDFYALKTLVSQPIKRGLAPKYVAAGGVAVLNQKCVRNWEVNLDLGRRHDTSSKPLNDKTVEILDILINSTGVGTLGRVAQVHDLREITTVDSHLSLVRPDPAKISPILLGISLTEREAEIEKLGQGSTGQTELNREKLGELAVLVPSKAAQSTFEALVSPLIARKISNRAETEVLGALRDTLMPKLISGELEAPSPEALGIDEAD